MKPTAINRLKVIRKVPGHFHIISFDDDQKTLCGLKIEQDRFNPAWGWNKPLMDAKDWEEGDVLMCKSCWRLYSRSGGYREKLAYKKSRI